MLRGLCGGKGVTGGERIRTRKVPKEKKKIILGAGVWQIVGKGKEEKKEKKEKMKGLLEKAVPMAKRGMYGVESGEEQVQKRRWGKVMGGKNKEIKKR